MRRIDIHDLCMNNKALVITVPDYEWGSGTDLKKCKVFKPEV